MSVQCPWCRAIIAGSWEDLEDNSDVLLWNPYIILCFSCSQFVKIEMEVKTIKMKLVEDRRP